MIGKRSSPFPPRGNRPPKREADMARNDFNGDGRSDILWMFHANVAVSNWLTTPSGGFSINDASAFNWLNAFHLFELKAVGDFNGDGRTDVLWNVDESPFHSVW